MSIVLDGTAGITFPVTAGSASAVQASSSRVLQVVNATNNTQNSTTSSTYSATGLTASITPSSTTSKILVIVDVCGVYKATGNTWASFRILKNGSSIINFEDVAGFTGSTATNGVGSASCNYLDSPATTSSITYSVSFASGANISIIYMNVSQNSVSTSTITLMEIAA